MSCNDAMRKFCNEKKFVLQYHVMCHKGELFNICSCREGMFIIHYGFCKMLPLLLLKELGVFKPDCTSLMKWLV